MEGSPSACRLSDRVTSAQITAATHLAQALILVPLGHRTRSECHCCGVLAARRVNPGDLHVVLPVVGRQRGRELVRLEMARLSRWEETIADGWKWRWHGFGVADLHPGQPRLLDDPSVDQPQAQRRGGLGGLTEHGSCYPRKKGTSSAPGSASRGHDRSAHAGRLALERCG
jgi:hypothetical protein